ncbi:hypothetical protein H0H87_002729 [Tephrocybe sp. NHM501043]|nr:hypothetical protein H0H87_002729 [Tephrocybe sp. NHM501043]
MQPKPDVVEVNLDDNNTNDADALPVLISVSKPSHQISTRQPAKADNSIDEASDEELQPVKRGCGQPCGSKGKPKPASPKALEVIHCLDTSVYVLLGVLPKLIRGHTSKGDKYKAQKLKQYGPFTLTLNMTWERFLAEVAGIAEVDIENLDISNMTWNFQRKVVLNLNSTSGYKAMIQQVHALKDPSSAVIFVTLPLPKHPRNDREHDD